MLPRLKLKTFDVYDYASAEKQTVLPDKFVEFFISKMKNSNFFIIFKNLKNICKFTEFWAESNDTIFILQFKN